MSETYWHGSNADFSKFSDEFLVRPGSGPNSALGIWLGEKWVAKGFGQFTYEVACNFKKPYIMPIDTMVKHHDQSDGDRAYFDAMRQTLLAKGFDVIFIEETDGATPTLVALNLNALSIVSKE